MSYEKQNRDVYKYHELLLPSGLTAECLVRFFIPGKCVPNQRGVAHHNTSPKPFIWTKSARDILQKVIRANNHLSSKQNATLH